MNIVSNGGDANIFWKAIGTEVPQNRRSNLQSAAATPSPPVDVEASIENAPRRAWADADGVFWATPSNHKRLPGGVYSLDMRPNIGPTFVRQVNDTDSLVHLPDSASDKVIAEIREFIGLKPEFIKHGFLYKRGILLWGPPGSGKTCTLQMIGQMLLKEYDSIMVLIDHPGVASACLQALRRIEPERQIIAVFEDLDALCQQYSESQYLSLLDGEAQVDNIVYVATTNYPERLDKRFVDRPSRFDTVRYIGMPSADARFTYLQTKMPDFTTAQIRSYVDVSEGYSVAHLRELIILTRCFGKTLEEATARLNTSRFNPPASDKAPDRPEFGFAA